MSEYAVLDVETTMIREDEYPSTLFWGYADDEGYKSFPTTKSLLQFLRSAKPRIILHHSNFDVLQLLLDGAPISIRRTHNARLIRCGIYKQQLLNSYSVFPLPLASIFECFGFKKSPLTCKAHSPRKNENYLLRETRERDSESCPSCRIALEKRNYEDCCDGLTSFLRMDEIFSKLIGISPLAKGTIAGTSFAAAQECAGEKMPVELDFLESYRGGRVEVYNTNKASCDKYDINSSYPFAFLECPKTDELLCVQVSTKDFFCPLFDASIDDSLVFPNGRFVSWVYRSNLEKYLEPYWEKTSIKVLKRKTIDFTWLKQVVPLIEKLYRKKNESKERGDKAVETASKLLLNSMYGRIGLKGESERCRILDYFPDREDSTVFPLGRKRFLCFDTVFRETKSNYPFAAFITDNARARLYRAFVGSSAWYGDTDSVITPSGKKHFRDAEESGSGIGQWKHEGREVFKANNVKDYFWGEDEIRKGGAGFTQWTLKTMAAGKTPRQIQRERISELRKRVTTFSGVTEPLVVNK